MDTIPIERKALERVLGDPSAEPIKVSYGLLRSVTDNFSSEIGRGGFGVVFLGCLGTEKIAVKKLSNGHIFSFKQFLDEITCLIMTNHKNIVRFLGYCSDTLGEVAKFDEEYVVAEVQEKLLVFEYVPNGNIQHYIEEKPSEDDWHIRYKIINGICQGLQYLHEQRIGHLDLKPENVMLDSHMEPKIADFGLSRFLDVGKSVIFTTNIAGTMGYIAPETMRGEVSFMSDIYALGIIVIRLLTGPGYIDFDNWYKSLEGDFPQRKTCIDIARACVEIEKSKRPTIGEIIDMLNEIGNTKSSTNQQPPMDLVAGSSSSAAKSLVGSLGSLVAKDYSLINGVRNDISYINDEMESMQALMDKLKRARGLDEPIQGWMKQVREVGDDIEYINNVNRRRLGGEPRGGSGKLMYFRKKWYLLTTLYARRYIATEIRNLKLRAQDVSDRRTRYGVENIKIEDDGQYAEVPSYLFAPAAPQLIHTKQPVGVEDAIEELQEWFKEVPNVGNSMTTRLLAIFGFGGLGKRTLAMELCRKFGDEFDCRGFVQVSQKFNLLMLLRSLVKQFHEQPETLDRIEAMDQWQLKHQLNTQLKDKRYLILIDDIWSVSAWENINDSLPESSKCGRVVVTTRFKSVAVACCRRPNDDCLYEHSKLDGKKSYYLFRQVIPEAPAYPTYVATTLLHKCGGLPLAIIVVAGLVASKLRSGTRRTLDHCLQVVDRGLSEGLGTHLSTDGLKKILDECYNDLPTDLKTCFLYLSIFPKGCVISRKRLIRRWIAEGIITEKHGRPVEEVGEDTFNELVSRSLIRVGNSSSNGKVKNYHIHDMVHQYIVSKSSDENFITVVGGHWQTPFPSYKVRRLSVQRNEGVEFVEQMELSHVRSLTVAESFRALRSCLPDFQLLHVLDLECCKDLSSNQLKKICKMHLLIYLSLRRTGIDEIPPQISNLGYLEVLDIRETKVKKLPQSVGSLTRMAHLLTGDKSKRVALTLTEEITKMTALQTLSGVEIYGISFSSADTDISKWKTRRRRSSEKVLENLEKLTSITKLRLYLHGKFDGEGEKLLLSSIEHLSNCSLKFLAIDDDCTGFLDNSLNFSEAPPEHLHTLELSGILTRVPSWIVRLHSLQKLTLSLTSLTTGAMFVLCELPELFSLTFSLDATKSNYPIAAIILQKNMLDSEEKILVPAGGFPKLQLLRFMAPVLPTLSFLKGATPMLQKIELKFRTANGVHGLEYLPSLEQVYIRVSSKDTKAVEQINKLANMINLAVIIDEYNESSMVE